MKKLLFLITISLIFTKPIKAAMESTNYRIEADTLAGLGGESESTSYLLQQTLLALSHSQAVGTSYGQILGFLAQVNTTMTFSLSTNSINFGTIDPLATGSDTATISVTSDAWNGYTLLISEDEPLTHTDTVTEISDYTGTIETPTTWSGDGFGFSIASGTCIDTKWDSGNKYAAAPQSSTEFHNTKRGDARNCPGYQAPASGSDDSVINLKVVPDDMQKAGQYTNNLTITAIAAI